MKGEDPMEKSMQKYNVTSTDFPVRVKERVIKHMIAIHEGKKGDAICRLLTDDEVINGIEGVPHFDRMNMKTSPGFPFASMRPAGSPGKTHFFKPVEEGSERLEIANDFLNERYQRRENEAKQGRRIESETVDCLKDERRNEEKVVKPRIFNILPQDHTMLVRKYFLAFIAWRMKERANLPSAVGMNVDSTEWHDLVCKLKAVGRVGFDGDYSQYDSKMTARSIVEDYGAIVNAWYDDGEENARVRYVLLDEIAHTIHRCGNAVYRTFQSNKSGVGVTTDLNTVINEIYLRCAWIIIFTKAILVDNRRELAPLASLHAMDTHTYMKIYGDDNEVALSDQVKDIYNAISVGEILTQFGITYTPATKGERLTPYDPIDKLRFLKRNILKHEELDIYLAPIDQDVLQDLTNWIRRSANDERATTENCENSLRFAYQWGSAFFEDHKKQLNNALIAVGLAPITYTFEDFDFEYIYGTL